MGVITSDSADNKLYYQVNQRYDYYVPLRAIFGDSTSDQVAVSTADTHTIEYASAVLAVPGVSLALFAGVLVRGSKSAVDVLLVGNLAPAKVKAAIKVIEQGEGRDINYSVLAHDDFYYRLSVRDRFITEILNGKYAIVTDKDNILSQK